MKASVRNLFLLPVLIAGFAPVLVGPVSAQMFMTLHSFTGSDGASPCAGLLLSGMTLYGTAQSGGRFGHGTVFALNVDGTGFTNLYNFSGGHDGDTPAANLILSGNTLYGTTTGGGSSSNGTVFAVHTDGTDFAILHSFSVDEGANPSAGLVLSVNTLYGRTTTGGNSGGGAVFGLNTDGSGFTNLHSFSTINGGYSVGPLVLSSNTLYGTTPGPGFGPVLPGLYGAVFAVNTDGTAFTTLHDFTQGSDGGVPLAGLVISGNTLYGTASQGGGGTSAGTVFKLNIDGTGFVALHSFAATGLLLTDNTLYGTTWDTIFTLNVDGTAFRSIYSFSAGSGSPSGLVLSCNFLYGTTSSGGSSGLGTVFRVSLPPPQLLIVRSGGNIILAWTAGAEACGFNLESATNLISPTIWTPVSPGPAVLGGQKLVVNPISGTQQFFRLSQ